MEDVSFGEKLAVVNNLKYGGGGGGIGNTTTTAAANKVLDGGDRTSSATTINQLANGGNDNILEVMYLRVHSFVLHDVIVYISS